MIVLEIWMYMNIVGIVLGYIYLWYVKKNAVLVTGIVKDTLYITLENSIKGKARSVKIEIEEDGKMVEFKYRPKSGFFNVGQFEAVEFYRTKKQDGSYNYAAVSGYYYNILLLVGFTVLLAIANFAL